MANVLILYGTTEGQTARIARRIAETLQSEGHGVVLQDSRNLPRDFSLAPFDAFIIGASVHYGGHQKYVRELIKEKLDDLKDKPAAFFSVSGAAGSPHEKDQAGLKKLVNKFIEETHWQPTKTQTFGGAILYTQYGFCKRLMMKMILRSAGGPTDTSCDHELTDWNAVSRFAKAFAAEYLDPPPT